MNDKTDSIFKKIPDLKYEEIAPEIDFSEFEKVVESRRSVRVFTDDKIPENITRRCLEIALLAPNSSNLQPWEFYWIKSADKKQKVIKACMSQPAARTAAEIFVCIARTDTWRKNNKKMLDTLLSGKTPAPKSAIQYYSKLTNLAYGFIGPFGLLSPIKHAFFTIMGLFQPMVREPITPAELKTWAVKTTALGCENLMLAFRAFGYDTCAMEGMDAHRVKKVLKLGRGAHVVMCMSAGKRAPNGIYGPRIRFDQDDFIKIV